MKNQFLKLEDVQGNVTKFEELNKKELEGVKGGDGYVIPIPIIIPFPGIPNPIIKPIDIGQIQIPVINQ